MAEQSGQGHSSSTNWFTVLDLTGQREQYSALFDFLGRVGARKIAANTWWFIEDDVQRFEDYCNEMWALLMSAAPNRPFPKDKLLVFLHGRGYFVGGPASELIEVGFAEPAEELTPQASIQEMVVTKSREELIAEGKIVKTY